MASNLSHKSEPTKSSGISFTMTITALYSSHHPSPLLRYPTGGGRLRPLGFLDHHDQPQLQEKLPAKTTPTFPEPLPRNDPIAVRKEIIDPLHQQDNDARLHCEESDTQSAPELSDDTVLLPMFRRRLCVDSEEGDDFWTLKRANPVYDSCDEDDETEQRDEECESPTKRQCQELFWGEYCEDSHNPLQRFSDWR
jgi:hypothetical protein